MDREASVQEAFARLYRGFALAVAEAKPGEEPDPGYWISRTAGEHGVSPVALAGYIENEAAEDPDLEALNEPPESSGLSDLEHIGPVAGRVLARLEDRYRNELMDEVERLELWDSILRLRSRGAGGS